MILWSCHYCHEVNPSIMASSQGEGLIFLLLALFLIHNHATLPSSTETSLTVAEDGSVSVLDTLQIHIRVEFNVL